MSLKRYGHLAAFALDHPWALTPGMVRVVASIIADRLAGVPTDPQAVEMAVAARRNDLPQPTRGGVAVIPVYGVLAPRMNLMSEMSGGTSYEKVAGHLRDAAARGDVATIVLDCDSPGGSCAGAPELAALMREVRATKPIIVQGNHQIASGAYWLASNATKIHVSPSSMVGSIGVFSIHNDLTDALAKVGIKRTFISAGKYKLEGVDGSPLTEDALAYRTQLVTQTYDRFVADIAKGRGVSAAVVRSGYGEGRVLTADDALAAGMVDRIATLDETLDRLMPASSSLDRAALHPATHTSQEPSPATDQDALSDAQWHARTERALLELSIP